MDHRIESLMTKIREFAEARHRQGHSTYNIHAAATEAVVVTALDAAFTAHDARVKQLEGIAVERLRSGGEQLVRYCPGCGSVGPAPEGFKDCCPDGGHARMIPQALAEKCHDTFKLAVDGFADRAQAPAVQQWIDDPHDIEQGQMLNSEWVKLQAQAPAAVEPVAWKWRRHAVERWTCTGFWDSIEAMAAQEMEQRGWEVIRLYAAPTTKAEPAPTHPDDAAVDALAAAMKAKLAKQRAKGYGGWDTDCTQQRLSDLLRGHVDKGDPVDVANFCAFLNARGASIAKASPADTLDAGKLLRALRQIADASPLDTDSFVCDFDTLQAIARAAMAAQQDGGV